MCLASVCVCLSVSVTLYMFVMHVGMWVCDSVDSSHTGRLQILAQAHHPERYLSQPEPQVQRRADDIDYDEAAVDLDQDMGFALFM